MGVNLAKGQRVSLDKNMNMALIGLGWDTNRYDGGKDFDLDASAFLLNADGKVRKDEDFIFYGNLKSSDGSVTHTGDNLTGEGDGDDEVFTMLRCAARTLVRFPTLMFGWPGWLMKTTWWAPRF